MAKNIFTLSHYFLDKKYTTTAATMLNNIQVDMMKYPTSYSNWMDMMLHYTQPFYEVVVVGDNSKEILKELHSLCMCK